MRDRRGRTAQERTLARQRARRTRSGRSRYRQGKGGHGQRCRQRHEKLLPQVEGPAPDGQSANCYQHRSPVIALLFLTEQSPNCYRRFSRDLAASVTPVTVRTAKMAYKKNEHSFFYIDMPIRQGAGSRCLKSQKPTSKPVSSRSSKPPSAASAGRDSTRPPCRTSAQRLVSAPAPSTTTSRARKRSLKPWSPNAAGRDSSASKRPGADRKS